MDSLCIVPLCNYSGTERDARRNAPAPISHTRTHTHAHQTPAVPPPDVGPTHLDLLQLLAVGARQLLHLLVHALDQHVDVLSLLLQVLATHGGVIRWASTKSQGVFVWES